MTAEVTPPCSATAEAAVLGGIIMRNERWDDVSLALTQADFHFAQHRLIWRSIAEMMNAGETVDMLTLSSYMEMRRESEGLPDNLHQAGGFAYLAEISRIGYVDIGTFIREVARLSRLRHLQKTGFSLVSASSVLSADPDDIINTISTQLDVHEQHQENQGYSASDLFESTMSDIAAQCDHGGLSGISTGHPELDLQTSGLQDSDLIIVAARPSMGKTAFTLNMITAALGYGTTETEGPAIIFSLEMPSKQLMMRLFSAISTVPLSRIRAGTLTDDDWQKLVANGGAYLKEQFGSRLIIDDTPALSPVALRSRARRYIRQNGKPVLIAVDYMQLMQVPELRENRTLEISEISRSLKAMAKEFNCPIVALSQLNRRLEQRADKRPMLSDLRESGAIEQDADLIMFLYRDEHYNPTDEPGLDREKGKTEIIIGKQRNGPVGTVYAKFESEYVRFVPYEPFYY